MHNPLITPQKIEGEQLFKVDGIVYSILIYLDLALKVAGW